MELIMLLFLHFIGDWALQDRFIADWKKKSWEVLLAHCFIYAGVFAIYSKFNYNFNIFALLFLLLSHFIIDYFTSRCYKLDNWLFVLKIDHLFHFISLIIYWGLL